MSTASIFFFHFLALTRPIHRKPLVVESGLRPLDGAPVALIFGFIVTALITTMMNGSPMIQTLRSSAIMGLFTMVDYRATYATLDRFFFVLFVIVLAVLLLEIFWLKGYVIVFCLDAFYAATRGIVASEYKTTGLFNTATSFEGRFNFDVFSIPRTSSIFLEQSRTRISRRLAHCIWVS